MSGVKPIAVPAPLSKAIASAGDRNGVDFDYLLQTAIRESSLNPSAKAKTSSAVGLFQFIEGTWLEVIKEEGPRLGYGAVADKIERTSNGYRVSDPKMRDAILSLREDPAMAADLAAAFTRRNGDYLANKFGRMPSAGELYIAHFMGARGAEKFFELGLSKPNQSAAAHFPTQARANKAIFFDGGRERSIKEVYQVLVAKHKALGTAKSQTATAQFQVQQLAEKSSQPLISGAQPITFESLYRTAYQNDLPSRYSGTTAPKTSEASEADLDRAKQFFSRYSDN